MPSFKGSNQIVLQPNTRDAAYMFHFTTCTDSETDDGTLPYNTEIASVTTTIKNSAGEINSEIIESTSLSTPDITVALTYPITEGAGRYKLTLILTLTDGSVLESDFKRIVAVDL